MSKQLLDFKSSGVEIQRHTKVAVLFGASGLIGNCCLRRLLVHQAYEKVISIGRSPIKASHPKLIHYEVDLAVSDNYRHLMRGDRSEEHTSELQSRLHLVCRLLLEKKNT